MKCETEFIKLDQQTDYVKKVEPLVYTGKLILGILCTFLSVLWISIIVDNLIKALVRTVRIKDLIEKFNKLRN